MLEKNVSQSDKDERDLKCPECGISFADFKKKGRCGCANDYTVFKRNLAPVLEKIHGSSKYIGKVPASQDGQPIFLRELLALRQKLKEVIRSEEYEKAARIRDRINELEDLATGPALDSAVEPPDLPGAADGEIDSANGGPETGPRDSSDREERPK